MVGEWVACQGRNMGPSLHLRHVQDLELRYGRTTVAWDSGEVERPTEQLLLFSYHHVIPIIFIRGVQSVTAE